ncbi:hypothetical protein [Haloprofundus salilacus]|uniref:hypothetical protein n=1 Tax=Haloprofundus salilacus TaxID=2876190 RepID=UPI001CCBC4F9|nr:hypothetical protein [Haloprofundus salilacus]
MHRRAFLAATGMTLLTGCSSQVDQLANTLGGGTHSLGDTVNYGEVEVTVTDAMTSETATMDGNEITSPSNGIFALFKIKAHNTDVTEQDAPGVNSRNYETLEEEDGVVYTVGINDIRVYGSGEGGHYPDVGPRYDYSYQLGVNGAKLETYPVGSMRPSIDADSKVTGWVIGVIKSEQTPQLKIQYAGTSAIWEVGDVDLSTPTPDPETIPL